MTIAALTEDSLNKLSKTDLVGLGLICKIKWKL